MSGVKGKWGWKNYRKEHNGWVKKSKKYNRSFSGNIYANEPEHLAASKSLNQLSKKGWSSTNSSEDKRKERHSRSSWKFLLCCLHVNSIKS